MGAKQRGRKSEAAQLNLPAIHRCRAFHAPARARAPSNFSCNAPGCRLPFYRRRRRVCDRMWWFPDSVSLGARAALAAVHGGSPVQKPILHQCALQCTRTPVQCPRGTIYLYTKTPVRSTIFHLYTKTLAVQSTIIHLSTSTPVHQL